MPTAKLRFRDYELDPDGYELCRAGHRVRLERKPIELLILLAENQGDLVKREEIIEKIWGKDFFFDAENGINNAIRKIRSALNDDSEQPRFVETAVGKGYRFVAPVEHVAETGSSPAPAPEGIRRWPGSGWRLAWIPGLVAIALIAAAFAFNVAGVRNWNIGGGVPPIHSIAVLPLENLSGDPAQDYFADGMTDELITELAQFSSLRVISRTSAMHYKGSHRPLPEIAKELKVDAVRQAQEYFEKSVQKDPSYGLGYAWLANTYGQLGDYVGPRKDFMLKSKETSQKALQLDDNVAVAHGALGWVRWAYDWDWPGAESEFK